MAKRINQLSQLACERARPGLHADGNGLYLRVSSATSKSWLYIWKITTEPAVKGKSKGKFKRYEMGLGSFFKVPLADARERAKEQARIVGLGGNPIELKKQR